MRLRALTTTAAAAATCLALTACSLIGDPEPEESSGSAGGGGGEVVLVTHESFHLSDELVAAFEKESGYTLTVQAAGDAGSVTNKLALTAGDPPGDAVFGIDNTFASRAIEAGVLAPHEAPLPEGAEQFRLEGDDDHLLTPVDTGNVCVNIDTTWFAEHDVPEPATLDDLTKPAYADLFVTPGATTSSPGMSFLLATIATYGEDGWRDYWQRLLDNGAKVVDGWEDAYSVDFTQGGGKGSRPIVTSYDSSPAFTVSKDGATTTTKALLDTCFAQVEYAGVLDGADNPEGAAALVDFLVSEQVQAALPDLMYVYPVSDTVDLPAAWARHAPRATDPLTVDPATIEAKREAWLRDWSDLVSR